MFLIVKGATTTLSELAEKHSNEIIGQIPDYTGAGLPYKRDSIVRRINKVQATNKKEKHFLDDLKADDFKLVKKILGGLPKELSSISAAIEKKINDKIYPSISYRKSTKEKKQWGDYLDYMFNYDQFVSKDKLGWNGYELAKELGVNVCSYCNRNYTYTIAKERDYVVRPEFDHFLPKNKFPILAISFYNLIPSCHICNSNLKGSINFNNKDYLHPYVHNFDDILKFTVAFNSKDRLDSIGVRDAFGIAFFTDQIKSFELNLIRRNSSVSPSFYKKAIKNVKVFKILELYNCHKDLVTEMVLNSLIYPEEKINELLTTHPKLFSSKDDVLRHITRNYHLESNMPKRPFSKLTKDIHYEFGLPY